MASTSSSTENSPPPMKKSKNSLLPQELRKFKKIPIYIVEYHNEVLEFIYRCLGSRHLPLENNTLIHFDSHPDMVIPREIPAAIVYQKEKLLPQLSIENWIMPTCYAGHFRKLIWAKNQWCDQIALGKHKFLIGEDLDGKIAVNFPADYFISEGNYCDGSFLKNTKEILLEVVEPSESNSTETLTSDDTIVLDIDLDYFSTSNPFLDVYNRADAYKRIEKIFNYDQHTTANANESSELRKKQLKHLDAIFTHLQNKRNLDEYSNACISDQIYSEIKLLVEAVNSHYDDTDIDWTLIYDTGCTSDHNGLPHHLSTNEELQQYYQQFEAFLRKLPSKPILITISRSTEDNYCPEDDVQEIQDNVIEILQTVYGDSLTEKPIYAYNGDEWDL